MRGLTFVAGLTLCVWYSSGWAEEFPNAPNANLVIRRAAGDSEIVITTTARLAGAIDSLTWNGREFINSVDHGRQLQSASSFSSGGSHWAEAFNPTEAGSRDDGAGPTSTSRLLHSVVSDGALQTTTQMAFWLAPDQDSSGHPALNKTKLSNHLLTKRVQIGLPDLPHVVQYDVTFSLPQDERHTLAQFEILTGYMPPGFQKFWTFRPATGELQDIDDGPGEQQFPLVFTTGDGRHAMGIFSPATRLSDAKRPSYGRWRFAAEKVVKWNSVVRLRDPEGINPGEYSFHNFVVVGDRETVRQSLIELHRRHADARKPH